MQDLREGLLNLGKVPLVLTVQKRPDPVHNRDLNRCRANIDSQKICLFTHILHLFLV